jgi:hypothetical protein
VGNLYVSFRNRDGSWQKAVSLGDSINSGAHDLYPVVSRDNNYLLFISMRLKKPSVYWVDAKIIEELKPKELK